ncbi:hypothetical protein LIER_36657 [Lithospermum erythrorhizon]|uniref:Uncharacterized protein n=1 Tax=Lithospermum erythrorhizon TaxID=34254 RepID=A0AAV3PB04_LITER
MLKAFLWQGKDSGQYLSKVSWKQATLRKEKGGLEVLNERDISVLRRIAVTDTVAHAKEVIRWPKCNEPPQEWTNR